MLSGLEHLEEAEEELDKAEDPDQLAFGLSGLIVETADLLRYCTNSASEEAIMHQLKVYARDRVRTAQEPNDVLKWPLKKLVRVEAEMRGKVHGNVYIKDSVKRIRQLLIDVEVEIPLEDKYYANRSSRSPKEMQIERIVRRREFDEKYPTFFVEDLTSPHLEHHVERTLSVPFFREDLIRTADILHQGDIVLLYDALVSLGAIRKFPNDYSYGGISRFKAASSHHERISL